MTARTVKMPLKQVHEVCMQALQGRGASASQANAIAEMLTAAERDGCHSHGLYRLPAFVDGCESVNKTAVPVIHDRGPGSLCVDGGGGFQPLAQEMGLKSLSTKAKNCGIGMMAVHNTYGMSGAMWYVAELLANTGLVSMVFANSPPYVAAHGGTRAVFGTNPMAFGWPRPDGKPPLIWDQASSGMARGEIELHRQRGESVPEGVGLGPDGKPTTDPSQILADGGVQLPFGFHKGSNIAMMVELLGAALVGTDLAVSKPPKSAPFDTYHRGLFVIAIDPDSCVQNSLINGEALLQQLEEDSIRLPSSRRYKNRQATQSGASVEIPEVTFTKVMELADRA